MVDLAFHQVLFSAPLPVTTKFSQFSFVCTSHSVSHRSWFFISVVPLWNSLPSTIPLVRVTLYILRSHQLRYSWMPLVVLDMEAFGQHRGGIMASNWHHSQRTASNCYSICTMGHRWTQKWVRFRSDNSSVVCHLNSLIAWRATDALTKVPYQSFYAAYYRFTFEAAHIPGTQNEAVDAISCNIPLFLSLQPLAPQVMIPQPVMKLLTTRPPE